MHPLQEKFQITVPAKEEAYEPWVTAASQRDFHNVNMTNRFNQMPPGMNISDQWFSEQNAMPLSAAGSTDVSKDVNPMAFANGYTKRDMKAIDDQYTGEHVEHFYGDAGGFVERNNYLDRE
jgi:hypothetical protein